MVRLKLLGTECYFSFWFFAVLALFLLLESGALAVYLLLPVAVHEAGHLAVMALCRVGVEKVSFTATGVDIRRGRGSTLGYGRETAVCLGGVAANLTLALLLHLLCFHSMRLMLLVASNIAVAIFNLLPIGNLDGGQAVKLVTARFFSPAAARAVSRCASLVVLACLFGFGIFLLSIGWYNPTLLVACGYLAVQVIRNE